MKSLNNDLKLFKENAEVLKALGHPVRLCIIRGLILVNGCNVSKIQECLGVPQSTISQHLNKLKNAGIIEGERNGVEVSYKVINSVVIDIIKLLFIN